MPPKLKEATTTARPSFSTAAAAAAANSTVPKMSTEKDFPPLPKETNITTQSSATFDATVDELGISGLMDIIKKMPSEKSMLTIGLDCSTFGTTDLQNPEWRFITEEDAEGLGVVISRRFVFNQPVPPLLTHLHLMHDTTLMYIFYAASSADPKLHDECAKTLGSRGWRYWRKRDLWLIKIKDKPDAFLYFDPALFVKLILRDWLPVEELENPCIEKEDPLLGMREEEAVPAYLEKAFRAVEMP